MTNSIQAFLDSPTGSSTHRDAIQPVDQNNIVPNGFRGKKHSAESLAKMSKIARVIQSDPERRKRRSKSYQKFLNSEQGKLHRQKHGERIREIYKLMWKGKSDREWAEILGCNVGTVKSHLKKHGNLLQSQKYCKWKGIAIPNHHKRGTGFTYKGKTINQWAEELGFTSTNIHRHLKRYGHLDFVGVGKRRPFTHWQTPAGEFFGIGPAAEANGLTLGQFKTKLKNDPKNWYKKASPSATCSKQGKQNVK